MVFYVLNTFVRKEMLRFNELNVYFRGFFRKNKIKQEERNKKDIGRSQ